LTMNDQLKRTIKLFQMFLKVNLISTSGPASIGLLYKESVGAIMTESQFVEAVGFSNLLPGSESLKLALFIGHAAGGYSGILAALLGSILPPTIVMIAVVALLDRIKEQTWLQGFINGLTPAVAVLILMVAWDLFMNGKTQNNKVIYIALVSIVAILFSVPYPLVLLGAGILGVILLR